ncbi:MAG: OmpH family outer membrane protein [Deltaproteobacteria bacterium]|nr:OmpH family outer membrane protein [Deltaproteobacteria bacterium]
MSIGFRRFWLPLLIVAGLLMPSFASAQELKIAFVDARRAVASSNQGKAAKAQLDSVSEAKRNELRPREQELKRLSEEFESQRFVLSKDALQEREIDLLKKRRDLERDFQEAQEEFEIEQRKIMDPLLRDVRSAVQKVGEDKGFTVILERGSPGVLYYEDGLDITDLVIQRLNDKS